MITRDYCLMMARYNRWQSESMCGAAESLGSEERHKGRGVFFRSIVGTLNHILWADVIWMSRFGDGNAPSIGIRASPSYTRDWQNFRAQRTDMDERIGGWAERLNPGDLDGRRVWHSGTLNAQVERSFALCVMHFFNHQTHHRGQVHAMLTAAGARPDDTDLFMLETR